MWTAQEVRQHLAGASIQGGLEGAAPRLLGLCAKVKSNLVWISMLHLYMYGFMCVCAYVYIYTVS